MPLKPTLDTLSLGTIVATFAGILPHVAAFLSVIWGLIRIYETKTVQQLLAVRRNRRINRRSDDPEHDRRSQSSRMRVK